MLVLLMVDPQLLFIACLFLLLLMTSCDSFRVDHEMLLKTCRSWATQRTLLLLVMMVLLLLTIEPCVDHGLLLRRRARGILCCLLLLVLMMRDLLELSLAFSLRSSALLLVGRCGCGSCCSDLILLHLV